MNGLPRDGKTIDATNAFAGAKSGRVNRILADEKPIIPLTTKDKVKLANFEGHKDLLKTTLIRKIDDKSLLISGIQKRADEFFERDFGIERPATSTPIERKGILRRKLSILENIYGKDVYGGIDVSDKTEDYQLENIYTLALIEIAGGNIK